MACPIDLPVDTALLDDLEYRIGRKRLLAVLQILVDGSFVAELKLRDLGPAPEPDAMFRIVHQLAGASATLGLRSLGDLASVMELGLRNAKFDDIAGKRDELCALIKKTTQILAGFYPDLRLKCANSASDDPENQP